MTENRRRFIGSSSKHAFNGGSVLFHRVRAQALPNRFERDHFTGRNVAEIDVEVRAALVEIGN